MKSIIAWSTAATLLPLAVIAESSDLSGYSGAPRLAYSPEVTQEASGATAAPSAAGQSTDEVAKSLANPNSPLAQLTFTQIYTQFQGDLPGADDQSSNATQFQPVFPFPLSNGANVFVRPLVSYVWKTPVFDPNSGTWSNKEGWADVAFDLAYGRSFSNGWTVVGGVQGTIPTDTDVSGGQWRLGPEFIAGYANEKYFGYFFPSHQWDIGGDDYDYSKTAIEIIAGMHLPNSWVLLSDSTMTYDHETDDWTIPINVTVRKVTKIGKIPVQFTLGYDYYVNTPDAFAPDWAIKFKVTPVVPNFIYNMIAG